MNKKMTVLAVCTILVLILSGCHRADVSSSEKDSSGSDPQTEETEDDTRVKERSIEPDVREQEINDCMETAGLYADLYTSADKGTASNIILDDETLHQIVNRLGELGYSVSCSYFDCNLLNYEELDHTLNRAVRGEDVTAEYYTVLSNGGLSRCFLSFLDGTLTVINTRTDWTAANEPHLYYQQCYQAYQWNYTKKGWLITEKAKSINQEMDMHSLVRVLPLSDQCRDFCRKYIAPIGYAGSDLFLTDWDDTSAAQLNLYRMFPYFYQMDSGLWPTAETFPAGIPEHIFEEMLTAHLPVSAEQLRTIPEYQSETASYLWNPASCDTKGLAFPPFPEVIEVSEHADGTFTLRVDAVSKENGTDCFFSHQITLRLKENDSAEYLGNKMS